MEKNMNSDFYKKNLFNSSYFKIIESIYYLYLYKVGDNFADIVCNNLEDYLRQKKIIVSIVTVICGIFAIIYCFLYQVILIKKLINYLSISRCVMKIIPTSVIISTKELEDWIESKY